MKGVSFVDLLDSKVVNNKDEQDWSGLVKIIESRSILGGIVITGC